VDAPQPLRDSEIDNVGYFSLELVPIFADKGLSLKEVETGWLSHLGNSSW
jgi:hypothetical protein